VPLEKGYETGSGAFCVNTEGEFGFCTAKHVARNIKDQFFFKKPEISDDIILASAKEEDLTLYEGSDSAFIRLNDAFFAKLFPYNVNPVEIVEDYVPAMGDNLFMGGYAGGGKRYMYYGQDIKYGGYYFWNVFTDMNSSEYNPALTQQLYFLSDVGLINGGGSGSNVYISRNGKTYAVGTASGYEYGYYVPSTQMYVTAVLRWSPFRR
jgi:hypothetical protein